MGQITLLRGTGRPRARQTLAAAALLLGISTLAACSSGSASKTVALKAKGASAANASAGAGSTTTAGGSTTAGGTASGGATSSSKAAAATGSGTTGAASTSHVGSTSGSTAGTTKATAPATTAAPAAPTGPAPVAAGSYTYRLVGGSGGSLTTGTTTATWAAPTSTILAVSSLGGGNESWTWQPSGGTTAGVGPISTTFAFNSAGVFLTSETVPFIGLCQFNSPVPSPPWPLAVGKAFSGTASCGGVAVTLAGRIAPPAAGGCSAGTFAVSSNLAVGGVPLLSEIDCYNPTLRLPVQTAVTLNGSYGTAQITSSAIYRLS